MKKILLPILFFIVVSSGSMFAQSNLTWIVMDQLDKGAINKKTEFNVTVQGISNQNEMVAFCQKIRSNKDVESCENMGKSENGYKLKLVMKQVNESRYYLSWVKKLGVEYVVFNNEKKMVEELLKPEIKN